MAKRRRVTRTTANDSIKAARQVPVTDAPAPSFFGLRVFHPSVIALAMLAGAVVYVTYYPHDSVAVERGEALWLALLGLVIAVITFVVPGTQRLGAEAQVDADEGQSSGGRSDQTARWTAASLVLDLVPWLLAGWIMLAAFGSSPPGNLRMATNEAWLWVTGACLFTASRRLLTDLHVRQSFAGLLILCGCGLAVHGLHQHWVSLPENRAEYRSDPEEVLRKAGIDAPAGSSERMVFENRLMDGGPTATFALANSLAGVLLTTVVMATGVLLLAWRDLTPLQRWGWASAALLGAACMMAARSRSATLALLFGLGLIVIAASRILKNRRKFVGWSLLTLSALGLGLTFFLARFGNREWFEQAPASLAFRFQYWRSTLRMVMDRPWFGAGPGNFQSIYEQYREAYATEQIAEPHNFVAETLAAGGFPAIALLAAIAIAAAFVVWGPGALKPQETAGPNVESSGSTRGPGGRMVARWVWLGALVAWGMVWMLGWISRQPPDLDASLFVIPAVIAFAWLLNASLAKITSRNLDTLIGIAITSIGIHLLISGGWTVPGVAIVIWIFAGLVTRCDEPCGRQATVVGWRRSLAVVAIGYCLVFLLWTYSLRPVQQQRIWMARAADAQSRGQLAKARRTLDQSVQADPWSPESVLWLADFLRWRLILEGDDTPVRSQWEDALAAAKGRAGEDPALYRMIGAQQLHVFQALGKARDLQAAASTFESAMQWSPSNEWIYAQMAAIDLAEGDEASAALHGEMADSLSRLGGNIERALSRQMIYIPEFAGATARRVPLRIAADQLLGEPNGVPARTSTD